MRYFYFLLFMPLAMSAQLETPFEKSDGNYSASYEEVIDYYEMLASVSDNVRLKTYGMTDIGRPLHLVVISGNGQFDAGENQEDNLVVMIMNGIHPGESCGVDASMQFARNLITRPAMTAWLEKITFCIIPIYNIGGSLNRSCCTRANQQGPAMQGFRGNGRLLDLNRDFIKADSKNARSFASMFREWDPHFFVDTHTSNGADYQAVMTLISTQHNKLNPALADYLVQSLEPGLYQSVEEQGYLMCPYVNQVKGIPDSGISVFMDEARYSTGFASLFDCIGFTTEAHMLKPFEQRVAATEAFFQALSMQIADDKDKLLPLFINAREQTILQQYFPVNWQLDYTKNTTLEFQGYEAISTISTVTGLPVTKYDQTNPYKKGIPYYKNYIPKQSVDKPVAYIIPQAWEEVIARLEAAQVIMHTLTNDMELEVEVRKIEKYETLNFAYEGHYPHYNTETSKELRTIRYYRGDKVVYTNQRANRFLICALEPESGDGYFSWNFFDEILMQKEYFSTYVFDDTALKMLENDPALKAEFEQKKMDEPDFASSARAQLNYLYRRSPYYEKTHLIYPVTRLMKNTNLPLE